PENREHPARAAIPAAREAPVPQAQPRPRIAPGEDVADVARERDRREPAGGADLSRGAHRAESLPVEVEREPAVGGRVGLRRERPRAVDEVVVGRAHEVHAVARAEVMPEVEARVDLEEIPATGARVLLEIHLE